MNSNDIQPTAIDFAYTDETLDPRIRLVPVQSDSSESDSDKENVQPDVPRTVSVSPHEEGEITHLTEKLAKMLLIYRKKLSCTIREVGTLLRKQEYDSTDVLLHLLGQLMNMIIRYTETFRVLAPLAPFMNDQIIKDQLQRLNESELLEKLIRDLLLSPIDRKSTRLNSSHLARSRMPSSA